MASSWCSGRHYARWVDSPHQLSSDELSECLGADSSYDYLQAPWGILRGEVVVKGGSPSVPYPCDPCDGPLSKYASLFDGRYEFDSLRYAFLDAVVGPKNGVASRGVWRGV